MHLKRKREEMPKRKLENQGIYLICMMMMGIPCTTGQIVNTVTENEKKPSTEKKIYLHLDMFITWLKWAVQPPSH
jgi:hypothetical protein